MPSKRLMGTWILMDLCLLAAGVLCIAFSIVWRAPNLMLNFTISNQDLNAGLALGVLLLVTWVISVGAIVQANHVTIGLHILNIALIFDTVGVTIVGSFIWFHSLRQRAEYNLEFYAVPEATRAQIQDMFSCCSWFNGTTDPFTQSNFCTSAAFAAASTTTPCVGPVTAVTDYTLNNIFTSIYAFMAPVAALFLATLCVINMRAEEERFKKIDAKRGRAFV